MESIFHEKQEGYLCAQHCLNALLQGSYFNAVDLANLAHQMDEEERIRMAESGVDSEDYQRFLEQPSGNMDDSGYFSVQVISSALKVWGLELIPYNGTEPMALAAQNDPSLMQAYICNYKGHWFTIRRIGTQWFNLNSMLSGPQLLSDTYLAMYLAQLLQEGYSIFLVIGALPECVADDVILRNPITSSGTRASRSSSGGSGSQAPNSSGGVEKPMSKGYRLGSAADEDSARKILEAAQALEQVRVPVNASRSVPGMPGYAESATSSRTSSKRPRERIIPIRLEEDDEETEANLRRALELSLREIEAKSEIPGPSRSSREQRPRLPRSNAVPDVPYDDAVAEDEEEDEMERALRLSLECVTTPATPDATDDAELRKALQLSLECVTAPGTPDPDDLRRRRLAHLGNIARTTSNDVTSTKLNT